MSDAPVIRLLVCGGRHYNEREKVYRALDLLLEKYTIEVLIHGDAPGADQLADDWAKSRGVPRLPFPAKWSKYRLRAGPVRNQQMMDEANPTAGVAFPGNSGTRDMITRLRKAGIKVWQPFGNEQ